MRSDKSTRLPYIERSGLGVDAKCGLNLLLVLIFAPNFFFSGYSGFPLTTKTNISKFQFDQERKDTFSKSF